MDHLTYPTFAPNQILTDTQLNGLHTFLDHQNRLTRTHGIGAGIVCGLEADYQYHPKCKEHLIVITPGYGFSSDGYLIELPPSDYLPSAAGEWEKMDCKGDITEGNWIYTHVQKYEWPEDSLDFYQKWDSNKSPDGITKPEYSRQARRKNSLVNHDDPNVWELLTASEGVNEKNSSFELDELHVADRVLILYLEKGVSEDKPCVETDCTKNDQVQYHIRALLVKKDCLAQQDGCTPVQLLHLPRLHNFLENEGLKGIRAITSERTINEAYGTIVQKISESIWETICQVYADYQDFLHLDEVDMVELTEIYYKILPANQNDEDFHQYHYDLLNDLITGHNEFITEACKLTGSCFPVSGFPQHLGLAVFAQDASGNMLTLDKGYRNHFQPSPVHNVSHLDKTRIRKLFLRIRDMVIAYRFPGDIATFYEDGEEIRITPSQTEVYSLGRRAIPYFYDVQQYQIPFLSTWQPTDCCTGEEVLAHAFQAPSLETIESSRSVNPLTNFQQKPLHFSVLNKTFYRIEGHLGKGVEEIRINMMELMEDNNLEFDVLLVCFEENATDVGMDFHERVTSINVPRNFFEESYEHLMGMEHASGVTPGGTFIIIIDEVCVEPGNDQHIAVADFFLEKNLLCCIEEQEDDDQECPEVTGIDTEIVEDQPQSVTVEFTAIYSGPTPSSYQWNFHDGSSLRTTTDPTITTEFFRGEVTRLLTISVVARGPERCLSQATIEFPVTPFSQGTVSPSLTAQPAVAATRGAVSTSRSILTDSPGDSRYTTRSQTYFDEILNLNKTNAFSGVNSYQAALDFIQSKQPISANLGSYAETNGQLLNSFGRTKDTFKKQAYRQILERMAHKALDLAAAETSKGLDASTTEGLAEQFTKLKEKGISLTRIKTNWKAKELGTSATIKTLQQMLK